MRRVLLISIAAMLGCAAVTPAVAPGVKLTPETGFECTKRCGELGMGLDAVVLIQNSAGCVCRPGVAATGSQSGAAAVAAGAMIALATEEARRLEDSSPPPAPLILPTPAPLAVPAPPPP